MGSVYAFPGQGSQQRGMGEGLFEKYPELVAQADDFLGYRIAELCLRDPNSVLNQTQYTQPALYVVNVLSYLEALGSAGRKPDFVAGHSLGEYCALFAAGAFDFLTGLKLVTKRGALMSQAPLGAMAAVVNLERARLDEVLSALPYRNIDVANLNCRTQCILSGVREELLAPAVQEAITTAGGAFMPLKVSAAFHSRCMLGVQKQFGEYLSSFPLGELQISVISNYTARPYPGSDYGRLLELQIANQVKWYESVSWLLREGVTDFREVGPGKVLTKLYEKISRDPMPIAEAPGLVAKREPVAREAARTRGGPKLIFMYAGQGSQYYQMGKELYVTHPGFRAAMDECSEAYRALCGRELVSVIYDETKPTGPFDDVSYTHAALYCFGHSLTRVLRDEGYEPDGVVGHSLGEYIAMTTAGALSFHDGLRLVTCQAQLLEGRCHGGLLSVLASVAMFHERRELFAGVTLASLNFKGNFVVSGASERLLDVQRRLEGEGVMAMKLPVRQAFHSDLIDPIEREFLACASKVTVKHPRVPVYSSVHARQLEGQWLESNREYLWSVIRKQVRFDELVPAAFPVSGDYFFVDLSASGSFANILKYGYNGRYRCVPAINQFGGNVATMKKLRTELEAVMPAARERRLALS